MTRGVLSQRVGLLALILCTGNSKMAIAQRPPASRDSVLVVRDLDGDGRPDFIVLQRKPSRDSLSFIQTTRIAFYLNGASRAGRPTWALPWFDSRDGDQSLGKIVSIGPDVSVVEIDEQGGDRDGTTLLLVDRGTVRKVISHGVDYGNGYFYLEQDGGTVVDATVDNLMLNGKPAGRPMKCGQGSQAATLLRFDAVKRNFVEERTRCSRRN